jgi:hypothetical protein
MIRALASFCFSLAIGAAMPENGRAQAFDSLLRHREIVPLAEGPNSVDLLGWGRPGLVVMGFLNNYNAHNSHHLTFYVSYPDSEGGQIRWDVVPFVAGSHRELGFSTHQGADCVLRDLRILNQLAPPPTAAIVLVAERDIGESYADSQPVTFSIYEIRTNVAMAPGTPGIYFERTHVRRSRRQYCDVDEALRAELGLGSPRP